MQAEGGVWGCGNQKELGEVLTWGWCRGGDGASQANTF